MLLQTVTNGITANQYLFHDQLGSLIRITDGAGRVINSQDFEAFGGRRDYNSQSSGGGAPTLSTRGYTGHEMVDGVLGMIHMNGRIFDPGLGRFLQTDPVIQAPANAQSWNAYTYVFNNPYAYTDPTGMIGQTERQWAAVIVAVVAAYFGQYYISESMYAAAFAVTVAGGFVSGAIASQSLRGGLLGAFGAAITFGIGAAGNYYDWGNLASASAEAMAGGVMGSLQGGEFGSSFVAAGITAALIPGISRIDNNVGRTLVGALLGGTMSEVTGGKFANGAVSGAIQGAMAGGRRGFASNNGEEKVDLSDVPTPRLRKLMASSNPNDRLTAAKEAADYFGIDDSCRIPHDHKAVC